MANYQLDAISTLPPSHIDKEDVKQTTEKLTKQLAELQDVLYAEGKRSLLIIIQGMDASGKDGAVKAVFNGVNPLGVQVKPFKAPTAEELSHDFLWRVHAKCPQKGMIQIFNRSHYEEVLITRVENWIDDAEAKTRFEIINNFEKMLQHSGTTILKFYLHISEKEQHQRFYERLTDPKKQWKYGPEDLEKAKKWNEYKKTYEDVFENCGNDNPWIIVPSDKNWYKEYLIAKTIVETLKNMDLKYPQIKIDFNDPHICSLIEEFKNK